MERMSQILPGVLPAPGALTSLRFNGGYLGPIEQFDTKDSPPTASIVIARPTGPIQTDEERMIARHVSSALAAQTAHQEISR